MTVREETQTIERLTLSPYAALSEQSFGAAPRNRKMTCGPATSVTGTEFCTVKVSGG